MSVKVFSSSWKYLQWIYKRWKSKYNYMVDFMINCPFSFKMHLIFYIDIEGFLCKLHNNEYDLYKAEMTRFAKRHRTLSPWLCILMMIWNIILFSYHWQEKSVQRQKTKYCNNVVENNLCSRIVLNGPLRKPFPWLKASFGIAKSSCIILWKYDAIIDKLHIFSLFFPYSQDVVQSVFVFASKKITDG